MLLKKVCATDDDKKNDVKCMEWFWKNEKEQLE